MCPNKKTDFTLAHTFTPASPRVLISDFGECELRTGEASFANTSDDSSIPAHQRTGATGTLEFMAPELLAQDAGSGYLHDHSPQCDLWSLGMVLHFLCFSQIAYDAPVVVPLASDLGMGERTSSSSSIVDDFDELTRRILAFERVAFPEGHGARVTSELRELVARLLNPRAPAQRPACEWILQTYGRM